MRYVAILLMLMSGCIAAAKTDIDNARTLHAPTTQPVDISQDVAGIKAQLDAQTEVITELRAEVKTLVTANANIQAQVAGIAVTTSKTVTYGSDVWATRIAIPVIGLYAIVKAVAPFAGRFFKRRHRRTKKDVNHVV